MRVEILKPVAFRGEVKTTGVIEAPDSTAAHWIATGAAKSVEVNTEPNNPPATTPAPVAEGGKKSRF